MLVKTGSIKLVDLRAGDTLGEGRIKCLERRFHFFQLRVQNWLDFLSPLSTFQLGMPHKKEYLWWIWSTLFQLEIEILDLVLGLFRVQEIEWERDEFGVGGKKYGKVVNFVVGRYAIQFWITQNFLSILTSRRRFSLVLFVDPRREMAHDYQSFLSSNNSPQIVITDVECKFLKMDRVVVVLDAWCLTFDMFDILTWIRWGLPAVGVEEYRSKTELVMHPISLSFSSSTLITSLNLQKLIKLEFYSFIVNMSKAIRLRKACDEVSLKFLLPGGPSVSNFLHSHWNSVSLFLLRSLFPWILVS